MTLFAGDVLAHQHLVTVEAYPTSGSVGARFTDGAGVDVTFIGDRSSVAMVMAAALAQLRPPDPDPDPPTASPLPETEDGEAA